MIKKIICEFEDVKDFEEFFIPKSGKDHRYIKVPNAKLTNVCDYKNKECKLNINAYHYHGKHFAEIDTYEYLDPHTEVEIIPKVDR